MQAIPVLRGIFACNVIKRKGLGIRLAIDCDRAPFLIGFQALPTNPSFILAVIQGTYSTEDLHIFTTLHRR